MIPTGLITLDDDPVRLRIVAVRTGSPPLVRVILSSARPLGKPHVAALKQQLAQRIGRDVQVEAQLNLRL
jgi:hypothetical protein